MLVRGVIAHQLGDDPQTAVVGLADEAADVAQHAVVRVDTREIGDVVAVVAQRRGIEREDPDRGDAQVLQVIELLRQAGEIALAVRVAVPERADMDLVDDRVLVPERIAAVTWLFTADHDRRPTRRGWDRLRRAGASSPRRSRDDGHR
jgi:hypothetical protein